MAAGSRVAPSVAPQKLDEIAAVGLVVELLRGDGPRSIEADEAAEVAKKKHHEETRALLSLQDELGVGENLAEDSLAVVRGGLLVVVPIVERIECLRLRLALDTDFNERPVVLCRLD